MVGAVLVLKNLESVINGIKRRRLRIKEERRRGRMGN